jgi:hypothetical protein
MTIIVEDLMIIAFVTMTKNMTNGLCVEFVCIIVMVVVNVLYDYKCSHIIHILT